MRAEVRGRLDGGGLLGEQNPFTGFSVDQFIAETPLRTSDVLSIGPHYGHTLRLWRERFLENWDEIVPLGFDDTFKRMWEFYLAYCEAGFRSGYLDDAIITIERPGA